MSTSSLPGSSIMPSLRYRDAHAAIDWLCRALGFERHAVYEDDRGGIAHAQLRHGSGMIMLGSVREDAFGCQTIQPDQTGGRVTQSAYIVVADCKAHYALARAAGARIVDAYEEKDYGGAGYSCLDPEGHLWSIGSYDPWQTR